MTFKNTVIDEEKEKIIAEALKDPEAVKALGDAMASPIRCGGMGYYDNIGYIIHGGYPYPEMALRAIREIKEGVASKWMEAYRKINDDYCSSGYKGLMEPRDYWDWREHQNDPDYFYSYSLWDTKRAIRDYLEAEQLPCLTEDRCNKIGWLGIVSSSCENCQKKKKAKNVLIKASQIPTE